MFKVQDDYIKMFKDVSRCLKIFEHVQTIPGFNDIVPACSKNWTWFRGVWERPTSQRLAAERRAANGPKWPSSLRSLQKSTGALTRDHGLLGGAVTCRGFDEHCSFEIWWGTHVLSGKNKGT